MRLNKQNIYELYSIYKSNFSAEEEDIYGVLGNITDFGRDIVKDLRDTLKPYKSDYYRTRDFLQPWYGVKNIAYGILNIFAIPFMLLVETAQIFTADYGTVGVMGKLLLGAFSLTVNIAKAALRLTECLVSVLRGLSQIVASPLTWLIKMPFRSLLSSAGDQKIEQNSGVKNLCMQAETIDESLPPAPYTLLRISEELHRKYNKQIQRGQSANITARDEKNHFEAIRQNKTHLSKYAHSYVGGFSNSIYSQKDYNSDVAKVNESVKEYVQLFRR